MTGLVTTMGEILVDFLPQTEAGQLIGFRMHPGGAPFNVAVGVGRLGQPVAFAGKLAGDLFGHYLQAHVVQEGIDTRFLRSGAGQSTLAFVAMENGEPAFAFYGDGAADTRLEAAEIPAALFTETRIFHCGSISLLRGSTPAAVLATAERLHGHALLSFDPNIRPGLVDDAPAYRALLDRLFALADIVKLSAVDLTWLAPGWEAPAIVAEFAQRGPALLLVTQGSQGVLARRGADTWRVPAYPVAVVDTVGAGDAFSAGLLAGLAERGIYSRAQLLALPVADLLATIQFAGAVAALTCTRPGADPPRRAEVMDFLAQAPAR
ncbi:MAG TPA: carbohydrate kinase [Chloroflexia bacterium]|nr:carbohydrate kinase [Chloroflexia bacterium]